MLKDAEFKERQQKEKMQKEQAQREQMMKAIQHQHNVEEFKKLLRSYLISHMQEDKQATD